MNKNLVIIIGLFLAGIIMYQAYLLEKLQVEKETAPKPEPKITVEIEKPQTPPPAQPHTARQIAPAAAANANSAEPLIDEKKIKEDFNRLFKDIFGNPKVQNEIKKNLTQMQEQLEQGVRQFQKELLQTTAEFQKAAQNDPVFADLLKNLKFPKMQHFTDAGDRYTLTVDVPDNAKSSVDVKVHNGILIIFIHKVVQEKHEENGVVVEKEVKQEKQVVVTVPKDADTAGLKTEYDKGKLTVTLPKKAHV